MKKRNGDDRFIPVSIDLQYSFLPDEETDIFEIRTEDELEEIDKLYAHPKQLHISRESTLYREQRKSRQENPSKDPRDVKLSSSSKMGGEVPCVNFPIHMSCTKKSRDSKPDINPESVCAHCYGKRPSPTLGNALSMGNRMFNAIYFQKAPELFFSSLNRQLDPFLRRHNKKYPNSKLLFRWFVVGDIPDQGFLDLIAPEEEENLKFLEHAEIQAVMSKMRKSGLEAEEKAKKAIKSAQRILKDLDKLNNPEFNRELTRRLKWNFLDYAIDLANKNQNIYFWLPTKQYQLVKEYLNRNGKPLPKNLVLRVSAWEVNQVISLGKKLKGMGVRTSMVFYDQPDGEYGWGDEFKGKKLAGVFECPAVRHALIIDNKTTIPVVRPLGCADCRACWHKGENIGTAKTMKIISKKGIEVDEVDKGKITWYGEPIQLPVVQKLNKAGQKVSIGVPLIKREPFHLGIPTNGLVLSKKLAAKIKPITVEIPIDVPIIGYEFHTNAPSPKRFCNILQDHSPENMPF